MSQHINLQEIYYLLYIRPIFYIIILNWPKMAQYISPSLVKKIIKENQQFLELTKDREFTCLKSIIEMQMIHLLETAIKFMNNDKREKLQQDDIIAASEDNNHSEYIFDQSKFTDTQSHKKSSQEIIHGYDFVESELEFMRNNRIKNDSCVSGRWLIIDNNLSDLDQNRQITSYQQIKNKKIKQLQDNKLLATIIKDNPIALLTTQELTYYEKIIEIIDKDSNEKERFSIEGDSSSLLPFFIKYLCGNGINQTGMNFLLSLLQTKHVWQGIQYFLSRILNLLLSYNGVQAFEVGIKITQLVMNFQIKYPKLRDIYVDAHLDVNYSNILKKIPFAFYYDITFDLNQSFFEQVFYDCQKHLEIALLCYNALQTYSNLLILNVPQENDLKTFKFWHPNQDNKFNDPYLSMII